MLSIEGNYLKKNSSTTSNGILKRPFSSMASVERSNFAMRDKTRLAQMQHHAGIYSNKSTGCFAFNFDTLQSLQKLIPKVFRMMPK